jgi:primary-amine oxidase
MNHWWKNAFDAGDAGLGRMATSLELGCDCLGEIVYLDAVAVGDDGTATALKNAICLHEEDYGILWKHVDPGNGAAEVRRSRRMVVSSVATVGNYEYGFFWYFYLDGTIQAEVKLTGIIQTQAVVPGTRVPYANPVTAELAGPHHQHMFSYRLDVCLDGPDNSVYEVDAVPVPTGPDNPYGNAFTAQVTLLETEARRSGWPRRRGRATGRSSTRTSPTRRVSPSPTSWYRSTRARRCSPSRTRPSRRGPRSRPSTCG